jgi:hypothetical protein
MRASLLFRIDAVLIALFAVGHTIGFRQIDPRWGIDTVVGGIKSIRFEAQGMERTYWDFYVGFGLFVTVFLLFAAAMTWQLGSLSVPVLSEVRSHGLASDPRIYRGALSELTLFLHCADDLLGCDLGSPVERNFVLPNAIVRTGINHE